VSRAGGSAGWVVEFVDVYRGILVEEASAQTQRPKSKDANDVFQFGGPSPASVPAPALGRSPLVMSQRAGPCAVVRCRDLAREVATRRVEVAF
jgi:hypothetical protein